MTRRKQENAGARDPRVSASLSLPVSELRVLLWDLDGTLVRGQRYGVFKDYTVPMLERVFGTAGSLGWNDGFGHDGSADR